MIDIVIPYKSSQWHDNELRYSLRSLEKFGRNVGNVFIVGDCPEFLKHAVVQEFISGGSVTALDGIIHIPKKDGVGHQKNIMLKLLMACGDSRVSENFIAWQDDYFLTAETDLENYPYYYSGTIQQKIAIRIPNDGYGKSMENTRNWLNASPYMDFTGYDFFDIHCPIIYYKKQFVDLMNKVDWSIGNGYIIKSLYANYYNFPIAEMPDLKFTNESGLAEIKEKIKGRHIFSICDLPAKAMRIFLEESYSEKSKYEK